jgi:hypothetical protein
MDNSQLQSNDQLQHALQRALGSARRINNLTRLRGGTKKGVYRVSLEGDTSVVVYCSNGSSSDQCAGRSLLPAWELERRVSQYHEPVLPW